MYPIIFSRSAVEGETMGVGHFNYEERLADEVTDKKRKEKIVV